MTPTLARLAQTTLLAAALTSAACSHTTWPPIEDGGRQTNPDQFNFVPTPEVVGDALSFVNLRYPPVRNAQRGMIYTEAFAFSLPAGADARAYDAVAKRVRRGAQPASDQNADLYTYFVSRAIVRGLTAEVDILRPVPDLGTDAQGNPRYQGVTVYLLNNLGTWKVSRHHTFPVGLFDVPARTTQPPMPWVPSPMPD